MPVLAATAILLGVLTLTGFIVGVVLLIKREAEVSSLHVLVLTGVLVTGGAGSGLMAALAVMVRRFHYLDDYARQANGRANVLTEQQAPRAQYDQLPLAHSADQSNLAERFSPNQRAAHAEQRVESKAESDHDHDPETADIEDLMRMARWPQAEQQASELAKSLPGDRKAQDRLERVKKKRKLFEKRHRRRMHDEIQLLVRHRRWREATAAARRFIEAFGEGPDIDDLRAQLETLDANAEIEIRQQLEQHIKGYIEQEQYSDALDLARRIIERYPTSPQANALQTQVNRLEELARRQDPRR